jgi:hypothetical protein
MGAKTNSGMEYLRKPSNGFAHIRLELFNQCLYGRFTSNIGIDYDIRNKEEDNFGIDFIDKIVLATEDVLSFKNLTFIFSLNWKDGKPVSVRIWYWDKIKGLIDVVYNEAKKRNNKYCIFKPKYYDLPIDGNAKKYYREEIEDFFVDWRLFGCNEKAITIEIVKNGKAFETVHFNSIKAFREKYNIWSMMTISQLINGKMTETRVKIINGERVVLKRLNKNTLVMEVDSELKSNSNTLEKKPSQDNTLDKKSPQDNNSFLAHELHIPNKTYNLKELLQWHKSETISQGNSPKKNNTLGEKDQD